MKKTMRLIILLLFIPSSFVWGAKKPQNVKITPAVVSQTLSKALNQAIFEAEPEKALHSIKQMLNNIELTDQQKKKLRTHPAAKILNQKLDKALSQLDQSLKTF